MVDSHISKDMSHWHFSDRGDIVSYCHVHQVDDSHVEPQKWGAGQSNEEIEKGKFTASCPCKEMQT